MCGSDSADTAASLKLPWFDLGDGRIFEERFPHSLYQRCSYLPE